MPPRPRVRPRRREEAGFAPAAAATVGPRMSAGAAKAAAFSSSARVISFSPASDSFINVPFVSMRLLSRGFHGFCRTSRKVFETIITGEHARRPYRHPSQHRLLAPGNCFRLPYYALPEIRGKPHSSLTEVERPGSMSVVGRTPYTGSRRPQGAVRAADSDGITAVPHCWPPTPVGRRERQTTGRGTRGSHGAIGAGV